MSRRNRLEAFDALLLVGAPAQRKTFAWLKRRHGQHRIKEIAASLGQRPTRMRQLLECLVERGMAERVVVHGAHIEYRASGRQ